MARLRPAYRLPTGFRRLRCNVPQTYQCGGKCQRAKNNCPSQASGVPKTALEWAGYIAERQERVKQIKGRFPNSRRRLESDSLGFVTAKLPSAAKEKPAPKKAAKGKTKAPPKPKKTAPKTKEKPAPKTPPKPLRPSAEVKTPQEAIDRGAQILERFLIKPKDNGAAIKQLDVEIETIANSAVGKSNEEVMAALEQVQPLLTQKTLLEREEKATFDYDGLMGEIQRLSGADSAALFRQVKMDSSLGKVRRSKNGATHQHDVPAIESHVKSALSLFGDKIGVKGLSIIQDTSKLGKRAYSLDPATGQKKSVVNVGWPSAGGRRNEVRQAIFHELAHRIEYANPKVAEITLDWVKKRSPVEAPIPLNQISERYHAEETAYPDEFVTPYVGRVYGKFKVSEVISTGAEALALPQTAFAMYDQDREHFLLTLGLLAG